MNNGLDNSANINIPVRVSKDTVLDNYGRKLLDLCKSTGLLIGNGRLGADKHNGDFTCITNRGRSILDYFLLSLNDFDCISEFCIFDPDEYSDHCALYICFDLKGVDVLSGSTDETNYVRKLVWSCENEEMFRNSLSEQSSHYDELIMKAESDKSTVSEVVDCFATSLFDTAYSYFGKTMQSTQPHQFQKYKANSWFDNTCKSAKKDFNRAEHSCKTLQILTE